MAQPIKWRGADADITGAARNLLSAQSSGLGAVNSGVAGLQKLFTDRIDKAKERTATETEMNTASFLRKLQDAEVNTIGGYNSNEDVLSDKNIFDTYAGNIDLTAAQEARNARVGKLRGEAETTAWNTSKGGIGADAQSILDSRNTYEQSLVQSGMQPDQIQQRLSEFDTKARDVQSNKQTDITYTQGQTDRESKLKRDIITQKRADKAASESMSPLAKAKFDNNIASLDAKHKTVLAPIKRNLDLASQNLKDIRGNFPTNEDITKFVGNSDANGVVASLHKLMGHTDSAVPKLYNELLDEGYSLPDAAGIMKYAYDKDSSLHNADSWGPGIADTKYRNAITDAKTRLDKVKAAENSVNQYQGLFQDTQSKQLGEKSSASSSMLNSIVGTNKEGSSDYFKGFGDSYLNNKSGGEDPGYTDLGGSDTGKPLSKEAQRKADAAKLLQNKQQEKAAQETERKKAVEAEKALKAKLAQEKHYAETGQYPTTPGRTPRYVMPESAANKAAGDFIINTGKKAGDVAKSAIMNNPLNKTIEAGKTGVGNLARNFQDWSTGYATRGDEPQTPGAVNDPSVMDVGEGMQALTDYEQNPQKGDAVLQSILTQVTSYRDANQILQDISNPVAKEKFMALVKHKLN
jgi:hypothetical protein